MHATDGVTYGVDTAVLLGGQLEQGVQTEYLGLWALSGAHRGSSGLGEPRREGSRSPLEIDC